MENIVIIGPAPADTPYPNARVVAPPERAWHAEPGRLWIEGPAGVYALPFDKLLLCEDQPLLLMALGCGFQDGRPVVDADGQTTTPGVFVAGPVVGTPQPQVGVVERLDPLDLAILLEQPPSPERNRRVLAQADARGPRLAGRVAPALPVGFAALAAIAPAALAARDPQDDAGVLA